MSQLKIPHAATKTWPSQKQTKQTNNIAIDWASQVVKNLPANAGDTGDTGLTPQLGRAPGEGNGNPLEYS